MWLIDVVEGDLPFLEPCVGEYDIMRRSLTKILSFSVEVFKRRIVTGCRAARLLSVADRLVRHSPSGLAESHQMIAFVTGVHRTHRMNQVREAAASIGVHHLVISSARFPSQAAKRALKPRSVYQSSHCMRGFFKCPETSREDEQSFSLGETRRSERRSFHTRTRLGIDTPPPVI